MDITYYKEFNGEKLFCRHVKPKNGSEPKCLVYICHGFGSHIGHYEEFFDSLSSAGIYVFGNDHYGHGKSSGYRVWIPTFDVLTLPCKMHIEETAKDYPGKKIFIYGHSMGGLIAVTMSHQYENIFHGMILEAPYFNTSYPSWMVSLGAFLGRLWPTYLLRLGVASLEGMTHDVEMIEKIREDNLTYSGPIPLRYVASSTEALSEAFGKAESIEVPILIQHGDGDTICPVSGSQRFLGLVSSKDKTLNVYEEGLHLLRSEPHRNIKDQFLKDLLDWINARC